MLKFILKNNLCLMAALAIAVGVFVSTHWPSMPFSQRMIGLFFIAIVMHLWEEGRIPGGFVEMVAEHLHFTGKDLHFGEAITAAYVLIIAFVPLFFPDEPFLAMAPMILGILEAVVHVAVIRLFGLERFYSPGMLTAVFLLLPISVYSITYAVQHNLVPPWFWLFAFLYMLFGLAVAQQIVVRASGMKYTEFLRNVRTAFLGGRAK
ncbi:MAG TPA: HXXEE domain-containing protein [Candidatus Sulfotelmatobacter sp.]|nr:HXXEE domain-containing protein [Candidatus Sulfotelmatobacter sp.]